MLSKTTVYRSVATVLEDMPASIARLSPTARDTLLREAAAAGIGPAEYLRRVHVVEAEEARTAADLVYLYGQSAA